MRGSKSQRSANTAKAGAPESARREQPTPPLIVETAEIDQTREHEIHPWLPSGVEALGGAPIPGAHVLADVAADNLLRDGRTHLIGNPVALFDRRVGQALRRIDRIGFCDGARRAGIDAPGAGPALVDARTVGLEREGARLVPVRFSGVRSSAHCRLVRSGPRCYGSADFRTPDGRRSSIYKGSRESGLRLISDSASGDTCSYNEP